MKDLIRRWLGMPEPFANGVQELVAETIKALAAAQQAHIADLRELIEKGHAREAQLSGMIQQAIDHQFYRSAARAVTENRSTPAIPVDSMEDVTNFDPLADAEQMKQQEKELAELLAEQNEKGMTKVG